MYRGMHHPLDVLGGVLIGVTALSALVLVARASGTAARWRRSPSSPTPASRSAEACPSSGVSSSVRVSWSLDQGGGRQLEGSTRARRVRLHRLSAASSAVSTCSKTRVPTTAGSSSASSTRTAAGHAERSPLVQSTSAKRVKVKLSRKVLYVT